MALKAHLKLQTVPIRTIFFESLKPSAKYR